MKTQVITGTTGEVTVIRIDANRVRIGHRVFEAQPIEGYSCEGCAFDAKTYNQLLHRACDGCDCKGVIYKEV